MAPSDRRGHPFCDRGLAELSLLDESLPGDDRVDGEKVAWLLHGDE